MPTLYTTATAIYHFGIRCASLWNPKAKAWIVGREGIWDRLSQKRDALRGCLWMHCASVGEFEQGRPVLEAIKAQRPELPVLLTFFSPSGYEARKDFPLATHVEYLPPDAASNAQRLVELITPRAAIFIKYEFWYHHLHALKAKGVPTFLVSAVFRERQPFFRWYGGTWRSMLRCYEQIFTQDERSRELLSAIGVKNVTVSGDTRFDRVTAIAHEADHFEFADRMERCSDGRSVVCGSTWPDDERLLAEAMDEVPFDAMIVPHEVTDAHVRSILGTFEPTPMLLGEYETLMPSEDDYRPSAVIVDRTGILASLYRYADVAYVGGGFGDGIHNLLEAAVWGSPVIFGPAHTKFPEAQGLMDEGAGWCVHDADELKDVLRKLLDDPVALANASEAAARYVRERTGATQRVLEVVDSVL